MSTRIVGNVGSLALVAVLMAAVHGAVLKSALESVEAGQVLPLVGADFHDGMTVSLVLVGVFDEHPLGEATANDEGGFTIDLEIPAGARLTAEMLACKRPGTGISPKYFDQILGRRTKVAIPADEVVHWEALD